MWVRRKLRTIWKGLRWQAYYIACYVLAFVWRLRLRGVTFVGVTGSAGKTTAKDLSAAVLEALGPCHRSPRSINRPVGVAETILGTTARHRYCVVEMSASRPGFLDRPLRLVRPDIAVMTLVARDHYSAFRGLEAIAAEKGKLIAALPAHGTAILNIDDPLVRAIGERCKRRVIWIGTGEGATLRLRAARSVYPAPLHLQVEYEGAVFEVATQLHGTHLALSVLAALGVGVAAGAPLARAIAALATVQPSEGRMQVVPCPDGVTFIRDDWKAPHWSMAEPLAFLGTARAARKVAIIGSISDSPSPPSKRCPRIARDALAVADMVVFVGPDAFHALRARPLTDTKSLHAFTDTRAAAAYLRTRLRAGDLVLLKGTNRTDHLVRIILDRFGAVSCWRERCGQRIFCAGCPLVHTPDPADRELAEVADAGIPTEPAPHAAAPAAMPVLIGLGNPGEHYRGTPHNVGHCLLEALARAATGKWEPQPEGLVSTIVLDGMRVRLFKPGVAMNESGPAVRGFLARAGCDPRQCLVVHDDIDVALGDVRLKRDGGDAGHKGVRSVIAALGTDAIGRLRIGVRRAGDARKAGQTVLERFTPNEETQLRHGIEQAAAMVRAQLRMGVGARLARAERAADTRG